MYDIGEDLYKTYIKLYPDISLFYDLFAYLLMSENKKEEAYNIYKKILKNDDIYSYKLWFIFLVRNGQRGYAISEIKKFGKYDKDILNILYLAYDFNNDYKNALEISERLVNKSNDENAKILCSNQLNNLKNMDEALKYLESSKPDNIYDKYYEYFRSYLYKNDYEKALNYIKMVLDSNDEGFVFNAFSELVDNSNDETVYKFLNIEHGEALNDSFLVLESIPSEIYKNSDEKFNELFNNNYIDCYDINEFKYKLRGRARQFIEKYENALCNDKK